MLSGGQRTTAVPVLCGQHVFSTQFDNGRVRGKMGSRDEIFEAGERLHVDAAFSGGAGIELGAEIGMGAVYAHARDASAQFGGIVICDGFFVIVNPLTKLRELRVKPGVVVVFVGWTFQLWLFSLSSKYAN